MRGDENDRGTMVQRGGEVVEEAMEESSWRDERQIEQRYWSSIKKKEEEPKLLTKEKKKKRLTGEGESSQICSPPLPHRHITGKRNSRRAERNGESEKSF